MLKKLFLKVVFSLFSISLLAQGFTDNFSDGNITLNPTWIGETSKFIVNSNNQLQLDDPAPSSPAYLTTTLNTIRNASWEFYVRFDFAPSTSNYGRVYLVSDNSNLLGALNGYYIKIGGISGTADNVSLYRQNGTSSTLLIDGVAGTVGTDPVDLKIRVTRDSIGKFELFTDLTGTGNSFTSEGFITDNGITQNQFFGVACYYTSTRSDKFFFDDFVVSGQAFQDLTPPVANSIQVLNNNQIELTFNEKLSSATASLIGNYSANKGLGNPVNAAIQLDSTQVLLTFGSNFLNGEEYELEIQNIEDQSGNVILRDTLSFLYFVPTTASFRDLVINEIFADPTPSIGLPSAEFIEIYNASNAVFDLSNWSISDASSSATLGSYFLKAGDYLILCDAADVADFLPFGQVLGVASLPSLNDSGDEVILKDENGVSIDQIQYDRSWYRSTTKEDGGYSLEQINPSKKCTGQNNFRGSIAAIGGTPGILNSVNDTSPDLIGPKILNAFVISADSLLFEFDEFLSRASLDSAEFIFSNSNMVLQAYLIAPENRIVGLKLLNSLDSGTSVTITIKYLADCSGNLIGEINQTEIALPELAEANDIVINEILFNPKSGGVDFVEIYNRSERIISLQNWTIANFAGDSISSKKTISSSAILFFPNQYLVLTEDPTNVINNYPFAIANRMFEIDDLPSYNDDEGRVYLFNQNDTLIDFVIYSDDMHFDLLQNDDGVSLERLDPNRGSNEVGNFHSAAENQGFATPAYINSQYFAETKFSGEITIDPELFSPDNDGHQDNLNINYQFGAPGFVANVTIYDEQGRVIKRLVKNEVLGSKGTFTWNGISDDGTKARIGIYMVFFEAFNLSGDQEVYKKSCVVAGQLD